MEVVEDLEEAPVEAVDHAAIALLFAAIVMPRLHPVEVQEQVEVEVEVAA